AQPGYSIRKPNGKEDCSCVPIRLHIHERLFLFAFDGPMHDIRERLSLSSSPSNSTHRARARAEYDLPAAPAQ
ncbi:MAG: hypothetical protein J2P37_34760, partial [Ktedonobacteraceae bacterium]|nr:hypothetical protein [Ktedonobacteraceae bacterium]